MGGNCFILLFVLHVSLSLRLNVLRLGGGDSTCVLLWANFFIGNLSDELCLCIELSDDDGGVLFRDDEYLLAFDLSLLCVLLVVELFELL